MRPPDAPQLSSAGVDAGPSPSGSPVALESSQLASRTLQYVELVSLVAQPFVRNLGLQHQVTALGVSAEALKQQRRLLARANPGAKFAGDDAAAAPSPPQQASPVLSAQVAPDDAQPEDSSQEPPVETQATAESAPPSPALPLPDVGGTFTVGVEFEKLAFLALEASGSSGGIAEPLLSHVVLATELFEMFVQERIRDASMACRLVSLGQVTPPLARVAGEAEVSGPLAATLPSSAGFPVRLLSAGARPRLATLAEPEPLPDLFDRACFRRVLVRSWRHHQLRGRPFSGRLWKAMRGTLSRSWSLRYFEMGRTSVLAYYSNGDAIETGERRLAALRVQLSGAAPAAALEGSSNADLSSAATQRAANLKGSFYIVPGRTMLKIPSAAAALRGAGAGANAGTNAGSERGAKIPARAAQSTSLLSGFGISLSRKQGSGSTLPSAASGATSSFPTRSVFQLVNPAVSRRGPQPRAPAPPANSSADTKDRLASVNAAEFAGAGLDFLTLCADSAPRRREWILRLRANSSLGGGGTGVLDAAASSSCAAGGAGGAGEAEEASVEVDRALQVLYLGGLGIDPQAEPVQAALPSPTVATAPESADSSAAVGGDARSRSNSSSAEDPRSSSLGAYRAVITRAVREQTMVAWKGQLGVS